MKKYKFMCPPILIDGYTEFFGFFGAGKTTIARNITEPVPGESDARNEKKTRYLTLVPHNTACVLFNALYILFFTIVAWSFMMRKSLSRKDFLYRFKFSLEFSLGFIRNFLKIMLDENYAEEGITHKLFRVLVFYGENHISRDIKFLVLISPRPSALLFVNAEKSDCLQRLQRRKNKGPIVKIILADTPDSPSFNECWDLFSEFRNLIVSRSKCVEIYNGGIP